MTFRVTTARRAATALAALLLAACTGAASANDRAAGGAPLDSSTAVASQAAAPRTPPVATGGVIDSIIPIPEALRRFRADLGEPPRRMDGSASREALLARFARAVEARDTAALRAMSLSRREFAYLYYPESPLSRPPYEEPPALLWFRMAESSEQGMARLLRRYGGRQMQLVAHPCAGAPERQGASTLWERCRVRHVRAPGDTVTERLFGSIIERGGRYKFVGYANDF